MCKFALQIPLLDLFHLLNTRFCPTLLDSYCNMHLQQRAGVRDGKYICKILVTLKTTICTAVSAFIALSCPS